MFGILGRRAVYGARSARLQSTLALLESSEGQITSSSLSNLTAAKKLGFPVTALLVGSESKEVAKQLSQYKDFVSSIIVNSETKYDHYLAEYVSPLIADILKLKKFTHFVTATSANGKNILPRVSALLDVQLISDVIEIELPNQFKRPIYAGNAIATIKTNESLIMASFRSSSFPAPEAGLSSEELPIEEFSATTEVNSSIEFVEEKLVKSERPDLGSAKIVVSGGRALKSKEQFAELLDPLASKLNAAIGASRAAVDSGFVDNSLQIGQTGKVVAPDLYVAVGISGAIQHLAGMKDSRVIVAINKDEESPIFNVADVGLVGDLFEVIPELTSKL